jgi:peptide/nickel transport system ATP-binding protein
MTAAVATDAPLLELHAVVRLFDVSPPWLDRVIGRKPRAVLAAVNGVSFTIRRGETLGLVGESGCGKSTVARLIAGLHAPTGGTITYAGTQLAGPGAERDARALRRVRRSMQMIFQDPYASLNPRWRVAAIVAEPLVVAEPDLTRSEVAARVAQLLADVGLDGAAAARFPHQFSGGQRQRISIARALASTPAFIVCDEPTSALDVSVQAQVLNLMRDLQLRLRLTYLFISHNLAVVRHSADRVGVMYLGRIVELNRTQPLFDTPMHPYTRMLLAAVPDAAVRRHALDDSIGEVPDALDPPAGCSYHPRCPWANARCRQERPHLLAMPGGGEVACHAVAEGRLPPWQGVAA